METQDIIALILVYLIIAASLGISMYCQKKQYNVDYRKIVHVGVGFFVFVWWAFTEAWIMLVFFAIPFAIVLFIAMFDGNKISDSELGEMSNKMGHRTGLFLYVVSINILIIFFFGDHWTAATIGIVAMTFGDAAGSIVGKKYGRHHILPKKSVEGTLAVFAVTAIMAGVILVFYGWLGSNGWYDGSTDASIPGWACCILAGAITAVSEMLCPGEVDNLANPLLTATALALLGL